MSFNEHGRRARQAFHLAPLLHEQVTTECTAVTTHGLGTTMPYPDPLGGPEGHFSDRAVVATLETAWWVATAGTATGSFMWALLAFAMASLESWCSRG